MIVKTPKVVNDQAEIICGQNLGYLCLVLLRHFAINFYKFVINEGCAQSIVLYYFVLIFF